MYGSSPECRGIFSSVIDNGLLTIVKACMGISLAFSHITFSSRFLFPTRKESIQGIPARGITTVRECIHHQRRGSFRLSCSCHNSFDMLYLSRSASECGEREYTWTSNQTRTGWHGTVTCYKCGLAGHQYIYLPHRYNGVGDLQHLLGMRNYCP